jgi:hypothetical protein
VGYSDCPVGYAKDPNPASPFNPASVLCVKAKDEVVKVGTGASAFWIDRYEASVWTTTYGPDAPPPGMPAGVQKFSAGDDDTTIDFPKNGQATSSLFALSVADVNTARVITWFQATEACAASGKRLPRGSEWLRAARRTADPVQNDGTLNNRCANDGGIRKTGHGLGAAEDTSCVSYWGAQDMIGNVWEWTDEWYAGVGDAGAASAAKVSWPDPDAYGHDGTWNIASSADSGIGAVANLPAATFRGGSFGSGQLAGVFSMSLGSAPSDWPLSVGFRCVIPR